MRILFLIRSLGLGGTERQLVVLAKALAARGHEVAVALFYPGGALESELADAGIPIHRLDKRGRWDLIRPLRNLIMLIRDERPGIVHGFLPPANILAAVAHLFAKGPKLIFGLRASNVEAGRYGFVNRLSYKLESWLTRRADLAISNSAAGLRSGWARGMPAGHGLVIPNGIDVSRFRPDPDASKRAGPFRIGMIARVDPMKDHDTFVAAAHIITQRCNDVTFVLAGPGTETLADKAAGLAMEIHGPLAQPERLIAGLDLAVLSSRFGEGFPNALAEAMASGVPVVATDVGDVATIVGNAGRVVPPGAPAALAEAVLDLIPSVRDPHAPRRLPQAYRNKFLRRRPCRADRSCPGGARQAGGLARDNRAGNRRCGGHAGAAGASSRAVPSCGGVPYWGWHLG